jgi:hypothetical protein
MSFSMIWRCLAAAALALVIAAPATAERPGFQAYFAAADSFDRLAAAAAAKGAPPRASDPEVASLIRALSDPGATYEDRKFTTEDLVQLTSIMNRAMGIAALYAEFGAGPAASDAEIRRVSDRNLLTYQNEATPLIAFVLDATSAITQAVNDNLDSTTFASEQRAGALQMRQGMNKMADGFLMMASAPGLTPENRLLLATALSRNASNIADMLTLSQRKALINQVRAARSSSGPQAQREYDLFLTALAVTTCEGLCAL